MINGSVAVIGAGIAGLTAANYLRRHGVRVTLFEAGKQIAGLARSYTDTEGFCYDFGAHFITNRLAAAIGVSAQCRDVKYYGESVYLDGRVYDYPFGLMRNSRLLLSGIASKLKSHKAPRTAAEWFRAQYGTALADRVALPLLEGWSGAPADQLSPSVGEKLKSGIAQTLWLKWASRRKQKAISIGYSHEMPENTSVWHVYPEGGVATLCERLAENVMDVLHTESRVEQIIVENNRVHALKVNGAFKEFDAVISTAPCHILSKLITGTDTLAPLAAFRYRPMIFVNLVFNRRGILPDTVLWTPGSGYPFFRLTETTHSMPWNAPPGKTIITADIGCAQNDPTWSMPDAEIGRLSLEGLEKLYPGVGRDYVRCAVLKTPIAYPVYLNEYEEARKQFERGTGIEGLWSIGRNGEFAHILMEDIYWRTRNKMRELMSWLEAAQPSTSHVRAAGCAE